ncbi:PIN domain-containing protein [Williamsia sp. CHRR-6]|uniref:PIN domain-containing protein n=1 Tax=Williamsia sp. CHRR-6 TaxID=2835871 RepID=UPI001BD974A1|nr:PIN domain-containing protein [Williamsia sp. CHRR-6]MBT0565832.1 PIN domain-containing protein [Williamsia sp. CHRR-6]
MRVLDASAVLALLNDEPGASMVAERLDGATVFTVNLAEILTKVVDVGGDPRAVTAQLAAAGVAYTEITVDDAQLAAVLLVLDGARQLSLGDRCCLAVALRVADSQVLTADRAWSQLAVPTTIVQIR